MDIIISHSAALKAARMPYYHRLLPTAGHCRLDIPERMPSASELDEARRVTPLLAGIEGPVGVLVSTHNAHHSSSAAIGHIRKEPMPRGGLIELAPGVRCVSPSLVPLQLAPRFSSAELLMLLSELLGFYAITEKGDNGLAQRSRPIVEAAQIEALLADMHGARCVDVVRKALAKAPIHTASTMEAKLHIRACAPYARGGYAMGAVVLNDPVQLDALSNKVGALRTRKPDLLFLGRDGAGKHGACIDYMGAHHEQGDQARRDTARRNELIANGFSPYEIYKEHYDDLPYLDALMSTIRSEIGMPRHEVPRMQACWETERRHELWRELECIDMASWTEREDLR